MQLSINSRTSLYTLRYGLTHLQFQFLFLIDSQLFFQKATKLHRLKIASTLLAPSFRSETKAGTVIWNRESFFIAHIATDICRREVQLGAAC